ncbi:MAG: DUF4468 domain-containing protein [Geobacteraceae bacterium]
MRIAAIALLMILSCAACTSVGPVPRAEGTIVREISIGEVSGTKLYQVSRLWLGRHLYSDKDIFVSENPAAGTLVANGVVDYPATGLEAVRRIQYTISFQVRVKTAQGKITLSFENFKINVPKVYSRKAERWFGREYFGGYSRPPLDNDEYAAVRRAVSGVCEKFESFLEEQRKTVTGIEGQQDGKGHRAEGAPGGSE